MNSNLFLRTTLFFLIAPLLISSCVSGANNNGTGATNLAKDTVIKAKIDTPKVKKDTTFGKIDSNRKYNDIARFIAGMNALPGSPYSALEKDTVWIRFHKNFDDSWKQIEDTRLKEMADWGATELAEERKSNLNIFYPFSGPDILNANILFPDAKIYHLYALERNGALPDLNHMKIKATENYLMAVYSSLGDIFKRSYFITHKMSAELSADNVNGTLPLICVFLVRMGNEIINLQYFHLDNDGKETPLNKDSIGNHHNDFVKVYFKNSRSNSIQMVSYMKCDLSDEAYQKNVALKTLFTQMPQSITYLKSASYLLHYKFFSLVKDVILNKSKSILEDDTGIPYKYLPPTQWNVTLYGVYVTPVSDFSGVFQPDLLKAYQDTATRKPKKLPFSLGYHWGTNQQNLIKAERKS